MNRPSHWIIATFAVMGPVLWIWGFTEGFGSQHERPSLAARGPRSERLESAARLESGSVRVEAPLSGRVVDDLGRPVAGALIRVLGGSGGATTRSSGSFEVMVKPGDPCWGVEITAEGFSPVVERCAPADLPNFVARLSAAPPWQELAMSSFSTKRPALSGEGYVHGRDGKPVAGAAVTALATGDTALTNELGCYLIPLRTPVTTLVAWHESSGCAVIEAVKPAQEQGLVSLGVTKLVEGASVSASLQLPDGTPASDVAVVLRREGFLRRVVTDASGSFRIAGLVAADYQLEALPAHGALGVTLPVRIESSGRLQEVRLVAERPWRVRVVDRVREPRKGAYVVGADSGARRAWAQTDGGGIAVLRGLAAEGATVTEVRAQDLTPLRIDDVTVEGETTTVVTES